MNTDIKQAKCNVCLNIVPKQRLLTVKGRYYINPDTNLRWRGSQCPDCNISVRSTIPITKRKCRDCSCYLPATRYFKCYACQPNLSTVQDEFVYENDMLDEFTVSIVDNLYSPKFPGDVDENDQS